MLCGGDEYGRTQNGNNNAYCQDNEISWFNWNRTETEQQQLEFVSRLIKFRHEHPVFRRPKFFHGREVRGAGVKDIMWFNPGGTEMNDDEWGTHFVKSVGILLYGNMVDVRSWQSEPVTDDTFFVILNASHNPIEFKLPEHAEGKWAVVIDTSNEQGFIEPQPEHASGSQIEVPFRAFLVMRWIPAAT
jgi:glycogen operon protein